MAADDADATEAGITSGWWSGQDGSAALKAQGKGAAKKTIANNTEKTAKEKRRIISNLTDREKGDDEKREMIFYI